MKKAISIAVIVIMVLALGVTASGCKGTSSSDDNKSNFGDVIPGGSADVSTEVLEALQNSGEISMYILDNGSTVKGNDSEWFREFLEYYKQVYNGTVDVRNMVTDSWENKFLVEFASGDNPDLIHLFEINFPKYASRGMVYSVEEMKEMGVVGFDHPQLTKDLDLVSDYFKYKGEHYTFCTNMAEADMLFVNEDLFKRYSVKSPSEYYKEGIWNWENFEKCASEITRDTDGDGKNDIYGYYGWDGNYIITAAGGELVHLNEDGKLSVGLDDSATVRGLENYANIYGRLKCATTYDTVSFRKGELAMRAFLPQNEYAIQCGEGGEKYNFEWSMVPFPLDEETNVNRIRSGKSYAWTVASSAKNPQGCINFMIALRTYKDMNPNPYDYDYTKCFTDEQIQMIEDCTRQVVVPIYQGVGSLWTSQWDFWGMVQRGSAPSEIVAAYKPMFEAQVAVENGSATK